MSSNTQHSQWWFQENEGKLFKRKKGRVWHKVEKIHFNHSYEPYYNFVITTVRLINQNTGRGVWRELTEIRHEWEAKDA